MGQVGNPISIDAESLPDQGLKDKGRITKDEGRVNCFDERAALGKRTRRSLGAVRS